ncbi:phytanoyl-CoA dioxygenase family protein [Microlunatus flavus]|uniref:Phytanoyl-CoA dioxygenase (PhyH) n=1 Tax=Microlunatus flavus TaxID=1036181 RepID=A0A1H9C0H9_9ACTN|nr:phytanoyl-CoA dioxygenase family protein [Microlunatus flavus]SEP94303.1 Phytanoyl-CoA dioxygenase (PhyH) [Microlunatus flavus]
MSSAARTDAGPSTDDLDEEARGIVEGLYGDGIVALKSAFSVEWVDRLNADVLAAFHDARQREGGAVSRGPERWYVEVHPEELSGFVDLVTHPWVTKVCETVLGPDYQIVEIGFDIPFAGAKDQPWHRDFPSPPETYEQHRLTSLAFNVTTVDTTKDMGPFNIALGTQFESGLEFDHQQFPDRSEWPRYAAASVYKTPQRGDVSARSALTIHRGTANRSELARPVVVLGVDAPGAGHDALHDLMVTRAYHDSLPEDLRRHLHARVVDELVPIVQRHDIEGLVMG